MVAVKISRIFVKKNGTVFGRNPAGTVYFADCVDGTFGVGLTPQEARLDAIETYIETKKMEAEDR